MRGSFIVVSALIFVGCGRTNLEFDVDEGAAVGDPASGGTGASDAGGTFGAGGFGTGGSGTGGVGTGGASTGGAGAEVPCVEVTDCEVADPCLVPSCSVAGLCTYTIRDQDGDGQTDASCDDGIPPDELDCNDLNPRVFVGATEVCTDGSDNDCNGVADCFDPLCKGDVECGCTPNPGGENCANTFDDDCDGTVDCLDTDCMGTMECGCTTELCENGGDDDCDGAIDCADSDCAGAPACTCQATVEVCTNSTDEDCDGLIDCSDPDCKFNAACLCLIPEEEVCGDGKDNDCNDLVDCGDPVCFTDPACQLCVTEQCGSTRDEDCDGLIDCADPSCAFDPLCPPAAELCNNDRDDDLDGLGDCNDPDCQNTQICQDKQNTCATARRIEPLASSTYAGDTSGQLSNFRGSCGGDAGEAVFRLDLDEPASVMVDTVGTSFDSNMYVRRGSCDFGQEIGCDDDSGGLAWSSRLNFPLLEPGTYFIIVDGLTVDAVGGPNEGPYVLNVEVIPAAEICDDDFDNDGDGYADCADSECTTVGGCLGCNGGGAPVAEYGTALCTDGIDNDCDGVADCDDEDCSASEENFTECCNGLDQNGNGIPDDFNCRCVTDDDCDDGQVCYTSTISACGIPCQNYFGEICPFVAAGSSCNEVTSQCEF